MNQNIGLETMQSSKVVYVCGNDISTDVIYPGRFMATVLPSETPQFAFADDKDLNNKLKNGDIAPGSIIVAGTNFGCGSSREQAVSTLKGYDLIIVAKGFARIFMQNAVNLGLRTVTCPEIEAEEADDLEISADEVTNLTNGKSYKVVPIPKLRQEIIDAGGLIPYTRKRLLAKK
ncbi:MAG: 3-isopropylmalate dehydratase small subunit [Bacteroidota bacterium]